MLERSLTRILVGVLLASNGVNVLFLVVSGAAGRRADHRRHPTAGDERPAAAGHGAHRDRDHSRQYRVPAGDGVPQLPAERPRRGRRRRRGPAIRRLAEADLASDSYDADIEGHPDEVGQGIGDEEGERVPAPDPEAADAPEVERGQADADEPGAPNADANRLTDEHQSASETR